jgi:glycosyltransferase involved in cell wall biosynthesis
MTQPTTLSVLMPNYNHSRYLPAALDAILAQSYIPMEVVVIDDGSTDDSMAVLEHYRQQAPQLLRVLQNERNLGALPTIHRLVEEARGDYLYFAGADDMVLPGFFERSMRLLAQHPEAGLCSTLTRVIDAEGRDLDFVSIGPFPSASGGYVSAPTCRRDLHKRDFCITGNTTIYHRGRLLDAGGFRAELGPFCDGFVSQAIALRHGACFIPEALAAGRWTGQNYATTLSNTDAALTVYRATLRLMQTEYADVFPDGYVRLWQRRAQYNMARRVIKGAEHEVRTRLARVGIETRGIDALILRMVSAAFAALSIGAVVVLLATLKRRDIPRLLTTAFSPRSVRNRSRMRRLGVS